MERDTLLTLARETARHAYCPYSHFHVGAALVAEKKIYTGVNIEISSYGLTLCAERSALAAAISDGARTITQIAIACLDVPANTTLNQHVPCGACLQWLADLAPNVVIYLDGIKDDFCITDFLPHPFKF